MRAIILFWLVLTFATAQHNMQHVPHRKAKDKHHIVKYTKNLGGISILGHSHDFGTRLKYNKYHALVLGINRYDNFTNLTAPNFDAAEVASVLDLRYKFDNIVLLVDQPPRVFLGNVKRKVLPRINRQVIVDELQKLKRKVQPGDALLFYYAGHGIPGYLVAADSKDSTTTMFSLSKIAQELESMSARHTLMILDSCFSGSMFEAKYRPSFSHLTNKSFFSPGGNNLSRLFKRRVFQVITSGSSDEAVADKIQASTEYAQKFKNSRGHSPFTAVLLQALYGFIGRSDGIILTSQLGYYMADVLVNDEDVAASQVPRYANLGGEGDFLFIPAYKVINPKLIAPLYQEGKVYEQLRMSACYALRDFIEASSSQEQAFFMRSVIVHLTQLLEDMQSSPRLAACEVLADWASIHGNQIEEFSKVVVPMTKLLGAQSSSEFLKSAAARCLGKLPKYSTKQSLLAIHEYNEALLQKWTKISRGRFLPVKVKARRTSIENTRGNLTIENLELTRETCEWLLTTGIKLIEEDERQADKNHEMGKALLEKSQSLAKEKRFFESKLLAARTIRSKNNQRPLLKKNTPSWRTAQNLIARGPNLQLMMQIPVDLDIKMSHGTVEESGSYIDENTQYEAFRHKGSILATCFGRYGNTFLSGGEDATIKLWNINSLGFQDQRRLQTFTGHSAVVNSVVYSPDNKTFVSGSDDRSIKLWDIKTNHEIFTCTSHHGAVNSVAYSPDGKTFVSGSDDHSIKIWDAATGEEILSCIAHSAAVNSVAYSPDGKMLISGSDDHSIKIWDAATGEEIRSCIAHRGAVNSVAYSPDGKTFVSGSDDRSIKIWNAKTGKEILSCTEHSAVNSIAYSPDGKTFVSGSDDYSVKLWDITNGISIKTMYGHYSKVLSTNFSADGGKLISASEQGNIKLWNITTYQMNNPSTDGITYINFVPSGEHFLFQAANGTIQRQNFTPKRNLQQLLIDSQMLVSTCSYDGRLLAVGKKNALDLWEIGEQKCTLRNRSSQSGKINAVEFSRDGEMLAYASSNTIKIRDVVLGSIMAALKGHSAPIHHVRFDPSGHALASASMDKTIRLWNTKNGHEIATLWGHSGYIHALVYSADGKWLVSADSEGKVFIWNPLTGQKIADFSANSENVLCLAFSPDSKILACGGKDKSIKMWDVNTQRLVAVVMDEAPVTSIAFSPDGTLLASGTSTHSVRLWDARISKKVMTLKAHDANIQKVFCGENNTFFSVANDGSIAMWNKLRKEKSLPAVDHSAITIAPNAKSIAMAQHKTVRLMDVSGNTTSTFETDNIVCSMAFSKNGQNLAVAQYNSIHVWSTFNNKKIAVFEGHDREITTLAFGDKFLVSAGLDNIIKLWDVENNTLVANLLGHTRNIHHLVFDQAEKLLASASADKTIIVWDTSTFKKVFTLAGHTSGVNSVIFSPQNHFLISASNDKTIKVWDVESGHEIETLHGHQSYVSDLGFSDDGKNLISGSWDRTIKIWDFATLSFDKYLELYDLESTHRSNQQLFFDGHSYAQNNKTRCRKLINCGNLDAAVFVFSHLTVEDKKALRAYLIYELAKTQMETANIGRKSLSAKRNKQIHTVTTASFDAQNMNATLCVASVDAENFHLALDYYDKIRSTQKKQKLRKHIVDHLIRKITDCIESQAVPLDKYLKYVDTLQIDLFNYLHVQHFFAIGISYLHQGNFVKAWPYLKKSSPLHQAYRYLLLIGYAKRAKKEQLLPEMIAKAQQERQNSFSWNLLDFYTENISEQQLFAMADIENADKQVRLCEFYYYVGLHHLNRGDVKRAQLYFENCVKYTVGKHIEPHLASIELQRLKQQKRQRNTRLTPYINRAKRYIEQNEINKAITEYTLALQLFPDNPHLYVKRAAMYKKQSNNDACIVDYLHAIAHGAPQEADQIKQLSPSLLQKILRGRDTQIKMIALNIVAQKSFGNLAEVIAQNIDQQEKNVQVAAIHCLGKIGNADTLKFLAKYVTSEDAWIRNVTLDSLKSIHPYWVYLPQAKSMVSEILQGLAHKSLPVHVISLKLLENIDKSWIDTPQVKKIATQFIGYLSSEDLEFLKIVQKVLQNSVVETTVPILIEQAANNSAMRQQVYKMIYRIYQNASTQKSPQTVETIHAILVKSLQSPQWQIRLTAIQIVKELNYDTPELMKLVKDKNAKIRLESVQALIKLRCKMLANEYRRLLDDNQQIQLQVLKILPQIADKSIVPKVITFLERRNFTLQIEAIRALKSIAKSPVPQLEPLLSSHNNLLVLETIKALQRLGTKSTVPKLFPLLAHRNESIRIEARKAIEIIGARPFVTDLVALVDVSSQETQLEITKILKRVGDKNLQPLLLKLLKNSSGKLKAEVIYTLRRYGNARLAPELVKMFDDHSKEVKIAAIKALQKFGNNSYIPDFAAMLGDNNISVKMAAISALENLNTKQTITPLFQVVTNQKEPSEVRVEALYALENHVPEVILELINIHTKERDSEVATTIRSIIENALYEYQHEISTKLLQSLKSKNKEQRTTAIFGLRMIGQINPARLTQLLRDSAPQIRALAAKLSGEIGGVSDINLIKALKDNEPIIGIAATIALAKIGELSAMRRLVDLLSKTNDKKMRRTIIKVLGNTKNKIVVPILEKHLQDHDDATRKSAALLLGEIGNARTVRQLLELLQDPNQEVQNCAVKSIVQISQRLPQKLTYIIPKILSDVKDKYQVNAIFTNLCPALKNRYSTPFDNLYSRHEYIKELLMDKEELNIHELLVDLREGKKYAKEVAAYSIAKFAIDSAPFLENLLQDNDPGVRLIAAYTLNKTMPNQKYVDAMNTSKLQATQTLEIFNNIFACQVWQAYQAQRIEDIDEVTLSLLATSQHIYQKNIAIIAYAWIGKTELAKSVFEESKKQKGYYFEKAIEKAFTNQKSLSDFLTNL
ncbi:HEAT repeat domain-containing protein [Candidatus Uabimicrobium amorphum]|uniref:Uncharacterized protein n=1 Tax=Uabimicrobium amorphum TaxID=2596890 RepID=A0A5S9F514_UABAM|nr:HEAT repeat domain-containing protein [Candidatus Uabimicrobium amorphum]BBM86132.1 hypothetical protein UABAM_04518 [Candidatus Uabimicrobium amorphum]